SAPAVPSGTSTLILVNQSRMGAQYGADASRYLDDLATFAARPEVKGVVYPIDSDPAVITALTAWDASSCDVSAEDQAVAAIAARIAAIRSATPTITDVVLVGAEDVFPMNNVLDDTSVVNEQEFVGSLTDGITSNPATTSAATRHFRTDDAYATDEVYDND